MNEYIKTLFHKLLPKYLLTRVAGFFAGKELGSITTFAINQFISHYNIDMKEALKENPEGYLTFNEFFTRELKPGIRPLAGGAETIVSPVDGVVAEYGKINWGRLIAAKGQDYSLRELLGGDDELAQEFQDGAFETIYLSPANYHRIHMSTTGTIERMIYVPGKYYSVNPVYVKNIDNLFAKNERVVCIFRTPKGPMAMILVGATIVGSMSVSWHGTVTPGIKRIPYVFNYDESQQKTYEKGQEMGMFFLGSTVITIFPKDTVNLNEEQKSGNPIKLGEKIADFL